MATHGGKRANQTGRPPKVEEQKLIESLTPMHPDALAQLGKSVKNGDSWAIKLFMEYFYGKPKETVRMTHELPIGQKFKIGDTVIEF